VDFDASRARLKGPDWFPRFRVPDSVGLLADSGLAPDTQILLAQRGGETLTLLVEQMAFHHVAQGRLAGEPYVVAF
jgi:hypothetical protein